MCKFSKEDKVRLGNAVIYVAARIPHLQKTKLIKLLYLMEEKMAQVYQTPFLALPYEVWQYGPVSKDVFVDLSNDTPTLLRDYISVDAEGVITPKKEFDPMEFSDCEIEMMDHVLKQYGSMTAHDLVNLLHQKGTLWYKTAVANNLLEAFENGTATTSDVVLNQADCLQGCEKEDYLASYNLHRDASMLRAEAYV